MLLTLPGIMQLFDVTKIEAGWDVTDDDDTDANRAAFPDAFRWLCCNVEGSRPGCRRGRHEANPELSLKGRGTGSQESSLERDPFTLDGGGVSEEEDDDSGPAEDNNGIANGSLRPRHLPGDRPLERRSASRENGTREEGSSRTKT
jgi:hypothetical protein